MSADMIAGYHDLYWAEAGVSTAAALGATGPAGIQYIETRHHQEITGDALGPQSVVDGIYQGASVILSFQLQEIKKDTVKKFLHPHTNGVSGSIVTTNEGFVGTPGTLHSAVMGKLEAIPRTGTPAASLHASGGNGRRFYGLFIGELREGLDTNARFIPVTFRCFPFDDSGTLKWWKRIASLNA